MQFKVHKAISDSQEDHKRMNYIVFGIILNNLICIIKLCMGSVYMYVRKHQRICKICKKNHLTLINIDNVVLFLCNWINNLIFCTTHFYTICFPFQKKYVGLH